MAVWRLQCINRESGAESEEVVEAESQQDAISAVNQRGLMVGKADRIAGPPPSPSVAERNAPKRTARPALPAGLRSRRSLKEGRALAVIGSLVMLFAGLAMDTAVNGVINIGLLAKRDVTMVIGGLFLIGGLLVVTIARASLDLSSIDGVHAQEG